MSRRLLTVWLDHTKIYRILHRDAREHYMARDAKLKIPAIILTSLSAGLAFSVQAFCLA